MDATSARDFLGRVDSPLSGKMGKWRISGVDLEGYGTLGGILKPARRASEGFTAIAGPALACASGWFFNVVGRVGSWWNAEETFDSLEPVIIDRRHLFFSSSGEPPESRKKEPHESSATREASQLETNRDR